MKTADLWIVSGWFLASAGWSFAFLKWRWSSADRKALVKRHGEELDAMRARIQITNGGRP